MPTNEAPLHLTIKAVDKATGPLKGISGAIKRLSVPMKGVGSAVNQVGKEAFSLGTKLAGLGVAAGLGLFAVAKSAMDAGDQLDQLSKRAGMSADAYASLQHAAAQADVEQGAFNSSITQFSKGVGQAKAGSGRFLAFLKKVSPELADQVINAKSTEGALTLMTDAMVKLKDPAKRTALSMAAFGDAQMGEFLAQGGEEIESFRKKFLELSGSQNEFAHRSGILDNSLRDTGTAFLGLRNGMMTALFPAFDRLAIMLTDFIKKNREGLIKWAEKANAAFQEWANNGGFEKLITGLKELATKATGLIDSLGGVKGIMIAVSAFMSMDLASSVIGLAGSLLKLNASLVTAKGGFVGLMAMQAASAIGTFFTVIRNGAGVMKAFNVVLLANPIGLIVLGIAAFAAGAYLVYKNWEPIKTFFSELWDILRGVNEEQKRMSAQVDEPITVSQQAAVKKTLFVDRPTLGAKGAAPVNGVRQTNDARVTVEFPNAPKGTRVTADPKSKAAVETNVGVNMSEAF